MRKLFISLGALLALAAVTALFAPSLVDWNRYKGEISTRVEDATGRTLTIDGNIALALLPTPKLLVTGMRLSNLPGSKNPDMVRLKALEAHVAFAPLLAGRIQIESLDLIEPQVLVERLADGRVNWKFTPERAPADSGSSAAPAAAGGEATPLPSWLQLDHLTVEGGTLVYHDAKTAKLWTLSQINGGLSAGTQAGPYRAQWRAVAGKLPVTMDMSLERIAGRRPAGFGLRVAFTGAQVDFNGSVSNTADGLELAGKLRASSPDVSAAAATMGLAGLAALPAFLNQKLALDGTITASQQKLVLSQLSLRLGESEATGGISFQPGPKDRVAVTLALTRIDLDKWLASEPPPKAASGAALGPAVPLTAGAAADAAKEAVLDLASFKLPDGIEATLDVSLDGLLLKGGVVRQIRFGAALNNGELALTQLTAELPGGSDVTIYGALKTPPGGPVFNGDIEAASDNLRGIFDWLKIDTSAVLAERMRRLSLSAAMQLTPNQLQLRDVDATLDTSHVMGAATVLLQKRPAFGASFAIDRLNLDAYLPQPAAAKPAAPAGAKASAKEGIATDAAKLAAADPQHLLAAFDANLRARIDELIFRGQSIRGIRFDGTVQSGALTVREASVDDLAGLKGRVSGSLSGPQQARKLDATLDLSASDPAGLLRFAGWQTSFPVDQLGTVALKGQLSGNLEKLAIDLDAGLLEGSYKLKGALGLAGGTPSCELDVAAKQPQLERLVRLFAADRDPGGLGELDLSAHVSAKGDAISVSGLKAQSGLLDAAGDFAVNGLGQKRAVKASLTGSTKRLAEVLGLAGANVPRSLDRLGALDAELKLEGEGESYTVESKLTGSGGSLALAGKLATAAGGASYDMLLDADDSEFATLLAALLPDYHPASAKLGGFRLHAKATGTGAAIALSELTAKLGPVDLTGSLAAAFGSARPKVTMRLEADALDLDPFLPAGESASAPSRRPRGQAAATSARWSTAPLELALLKSIDADVTLDTPSLTYGQYRIEGAKLAATLDRSVLALGGLSGKLYGGDLKIAGKLDGTALPAASLSLRLDGANLGQAGLKLGAVKLTNGLLSLSADLATSGGSELALVRGLNGGGTLGMQGGDIAGLDLGAVNARLAKPARAADVLGLVQAATSRGETKIERLAGTFTVKDGEAENKDLVIQADGASGEGHGSLDLPRWYLEYETSFKLAAVADAPPFVIKFTGAPDEPRKFLYANEFERWLAKREAAALVKGAVKGGARNSTEGAVEDIIKSLEKK